MTDFASAFAWLWPNQKFRKAKTRSATLHRHNSNAYDRAPNPVEMGSEQGSEINQLRATLDQVQKELVQMRAQIDAIDARCTIMMQAAPEAREELEQQKCETCQAVKTSAPHVTATRAYRQWATEQEERAQQARDVEPHPQAMSQPYHSVKKLTLTSSPVLLVDGYIPACFGPQSAERYFTCLLKSNTIPPWRHSGRQGDPFLIASVPRHIRDNSPNQTDWVLDRMVVRSGTVVPQTLWTPHTVVTDRRRHVGELYMPIFFQHRDGRLGLPLDDVTISGCITLLNAWDFAPVGPASTTCIRILVSGIYSAVVNLTFIESATTF